jgi:hypothetical protein
MPEEGPEMTATTGLSRLDRRMAGTRQALADAALQAVGRFTVPDAGITLSAVASGLLALLRQPQRHPEHAGQASSTSSPRA